jgi:heterodisulfide reductase subunit C
VKKDGNVVRSLNSILWDKSLRKLTKKRINKTVVQSVMTCGAEVWDVSRKNRDKLLATGMDCLPRSCRRTRSDRMRNETIREMVEIDNDIMDEVQKRQLILYGRTNRMEEARWRREY